jgi:hypothetical protein
MKKRKELTWLSMMKNGGWLKVKKRKPTYEDGLIEGYEKAKHEFFSKLVEMKWL